MKILMMLFRSKKSFDEMIKLSETREDLYKKVPGLLQIVYMKDERTNQAGGILFFDNEDDLNNYRVSDLAKSIPEFYHLIQPPELQIFDLIKQVIN
ncbi:MAG: hypothetical protein HGN29_08455 [Asgard group archaeon]|nr:hypothetical protein [Asgard group archaeon]